MTHFVGFAIAAEDADLDVLLEPYSENLEVPEYVDHTDWEGTLEQRRQFMAKHYPEQDAEAGTVLEKLNNFDGEWRPYDGGYARFTTYNPQSIWDWWVIGGRWDGKHAADNRTTVAAYLARLADDPDYIPPRVAFDSDGVLRQGREGWWGFVENDVEDRAWRTAVIERLHLHADDDVVTFLDLHI